MKKSDYALLERLILMQRLVEKTFKPNTQVASLRAHICKWPRHLSARRVEQTSGAVGRAARARPPGPRAPRDANRTPVRSSETGRPYLLPTTVRCVTLRGYEANASIFLN